MNIYEKLNKIQTELKAPKGQYNDFGKYQYRSCEDVLEGLKPLLQETKTCIIIKDEIVVVGERYYVKAIVRLYDIEKPENNIESVACAREEESKKGMDGSQVTGASSSYARKYALNGLFAIDDTKDSDGTNSGSNKNNKKTEEVDIKKKIQTMLDFLCDKDKDRIAKALDHYTKFTNKDKEEVAGITDINKLSGKREQVTYGKIKTDYLKKGGKEL